MSKHKVTIQTDEIGEAIADYINAKVEWIVDSLLIIFIPLILGLLVLCLPFIYVLQREPFPQDMLITGLLVFCIVSWFLGVLIFLLVEGPYNNLKRALRNVPSKYIKIECETEDKLAEAETPKRRKELHDELLKQREAKL